MLLGHAIGIFVMAIISGVGAFITFYVGGVLKVSELWRYVLVGVSIPILIFLVLFILFLWHLIKSPAPIQRDANFIINFHTPPIIFSGGGGLQPAEDKMQWVRALTNIEVNYPTKIQNVQLLLKGKKWIAHEWTPIMSNMIMNPKHYHFQVPTSVDLTKHKAQLVVSTSDEDYGSDKFIIKQ
jgi:hypothetical protein